MKLWHRSIPLFIICVLLCFSTVACFFGVRCSTYRNILCVSYMLCSWRHPWGLGPCWRSRFFQLMLGLTCFFGAGWGLGLSDLHRTFSWQEPHFFSSGNFRWYVFFGFHGLALGFCIELRARVARADMERWDVTEMLRLRVETWFFGCLLKLGNPHLHIIFTQKWAQDSFRWIIRSWKCEDRSLSSLSSWVSSRFPQTFLVSLVVWGGLLPGGFDKSSEAIGCGNLKNGPRHLKGRSLVHLKLGIPLKGGYWDRSHGLEHHFLHWNGLLAAPCSKKRAVARDQMTHPSPAADGKVPWRSTEVGSQNHRPRRVLLAWAGPNLDDLEGWNSWEILNEYSKTQ